MRGARSVRVVGAGKLLSPVFALDPGAYHPSELMIGLVVGLVGTVLAIAMRRATAWGVLALAAIVLVARGSMPVLLGLAIVFAIPLSSPRATGLRSALGIACVMSLVAWGVPAAMPWWARIVTPSSVLVAAVGLRRIGAGTRWLAPVVLGVSSAGIWLSVPDTEVAIFVMGVLAPVVLSTASSKRFGAMRFDALPTWSCATLVSCAAMLGSKGRPAVLPGALMCWGLAIGFGLVWLPKVIRVPRSLVSTKAATVVMAHIAVVLAGSRWAARTTSITASVVRSTTLLAIVSLASAVLVVTDRDRGPMKRERRRR